MGWVSSTITSPCGPHASRAGPIAIEFRDDRVRAVQMANDRRCEVIAAASIACDHEHPERSAALLMDAIESGGFRGGACVVGLPLHAVRAETITVVDADDAVLLREMERTAPLRHGIVRPQAGLLRLGPAGPGRVDIAAVLADRDVVEAILHPLVDHGLLPDAAEPSFVSAARAGTRLARREADRSQVRVVLDLHEYGAVAMLLAGEAIVWCRSVDDRHEAAEAVAACLHDGVPHAGGAATEVRLIGTRTSDEHLRRSLASACDVAIVMDDRLGTLTDARQQIGVRGRPDDDALAWAGVVGLAFRTIARRATQRKEAA